MHADLHDCPYTKLLRHSMLLGQSTSYAVRRSELSLELQGMTLPRPSEVSPRHRSKLVMCARVGPAAADSCTMSTTEIALHHAALCRSLSGAGAVLHLCRDLRPMSGKLGLFIRLPLCMLPCKRKLWPLVALRTLRKRAFKRASARFDTSVRGGTTMSLGSSRSSCGFCPAAMLASSCCGSTAAQMVVQRSGDDGRLMMPCRHSSSRAELPHL